MSDMELACSRCGRRVVHCCDDGVADALVQLFRWVPEEVEPGVASALAAITPVEVQAKAPFFGSQEWSYALFPKDTARSFHALLHGVARAAGLDPHELIAAAHPSPMTEELVHARPRVQLPFAPEWAELPVDDPDGEIATSWGQKLRGGAVSLKLALNVATAPMAEGSGVLDAALRTAAEASIGMWLGERAGPWRAAGDYTWIGDFARHPYQPTHQIRHHMIGVIRDVYVRRESAMLFTRREWDKRDRPSGPDRRVDPQTGAIVHAGKQLSTVADEKGRVEWSIAAMPTRGA